MAFRCSNRLAWLACRLMKRTEVVRTNPLNYLAHRLKPVKFQDMNRWRVHTKPIRKPMMIFHPKIPLFVGMYMWIWKKSTGSELCNRRRYIQSSNQWIRSNLSRLVLLRRRKSRSWSKGGGRPAISCKLTWTFWAGLPYHASSNSTSKHIDLR